MKYIVTGRFYDRDAKHIYEIGDSYPLKGKPAKARIESLLTGRNAVGKPFIKEVVEDYTEPGQPLDDIDTLGDELFEGGR